VKNFWGVFMFGIFYYLLVLIVYLAIFLRKSKISFNIFAGVFQELYLIYKRQWKKLIYFLVIDIGLLVLDIVRDTYLNKFSDFAFEQIKFYKIILPIILDLVRFAVFGICWEKKENLTT
jgi:hypothetical protein